MNIEKQKEICAVMGTRFAAWLAEQANAPQVIKGDELDEARAQRALLIKQAYDETLAIGITPAGQQWKMAADDQTRADVAGLASAVGMKISLDRAPQSVTLPALPIPVTLPLNDALAAMLDYADQIITSKTRLADKIGLITQAENAQAIAAVTW